MDAGRLRLELDARQMGGLRSELIDQRQSRSVDKIGEIDSEIHLKAFERDAKTER